MLARLHWRQIVLLVFLSWCAQLCAPLAARTPSLSDADLLALLTRLMENRSFNAKLEVQYTSDEIWHNRNFDKNGRLTVDESAKYENVFVGGLPYRKKVETNGKPLGGKEAVAEERRYQKAVRERRSMTVQQKRMALFNWHSSFPDCCLSTLFFNHIVGYEQIEGRDVVIVESVPRPDAEPKNDDERSALNWKQKSWIDLADAMFARIEVELLKDHDHMSKGMAARIDFQRAIDTPSDGAHPERAVWLQRSSTSKARFKFLWIDVNGTSEQTWSNYKKFHVDLRLLEDTVTPVSEQRGESKE